MLDVRFIRWPGRHIWPSRRHCRIGNLLSALTSPRYQEYQSDTDADGAIGHVEGGEADLIPAALVEVKANEINDAAPRRQQTVGEVAGDAAEDQPEGDLPRERARVEMMPAQKKHQQRNQRDDGEQFVVAAEEAPRRAGV